MRNKRIFLGLLLVIVLMAFAGCSDTKDNASIDPNTRNSVTDGNGDGMYDDGVNNGTDGLQNDVNRAVDDAGGVVDNLTTNGAVNNNGL